jgi:hypothetical protein
MNDDELAAAVKEAVRGAHMNIPAEQIMRRSRAVRARRRVPLGAGALAVATGAALAVTALAPASHQGGHQPTVQLAAWTVDRLASGNISVTIRELTDPAGLQRKLRADGVLASVTFTSQQNPACRAYPGGTPGHTPSLRVTPLLRRVFPEPYYGLRRLPGRPKTRRGSFRKPGSAQASSRRLLGLRGNLISIVIDPSALPSHTGVQIATSHGLLRGIFAVDLPTVVYASPRCTGS